MNNNHEVTYTADIFGDGDGQYFYTVDLVEKRRWRIRATTTRLGHGQTETFGSALEACRRVMDLNVPESKDVDAAPKVTE